MPELVLPEIILQSRIGLKYFVSTVKIDSFYETIAVRAKRRKVSFDRDNLDWGNPVFLTRNPTRESALEDHARIVRKLKEQAAESRKAA